MFGVDIILVPRLLFACALIVLFAIDLEHHLLPNVITLPGIAVGLAFSALLPPGIVDALIGTVIGGGILWLIGEAYFRYSGVEGMGGGDVKMLAMIGAFLGWKLVILTLVLSSFAGALVGLLVIAIQPWRDEIRPALRHIPFARRARFLPRRRPHRHVVSRPLLITIGFSGIFRLKYRFCYRTVPFRDARGHFTPTRLLSALPKPCR